MSTGKTLLIVGGVAVGAYVLLKALAPARPVAAYRPVTGSAPAGTTLFGLLPSITSLFGSGSSPANTSSTPFLSTGSFAPAAGIDSPAQQGYAISHGVIDDSGTTLVDLNTGNALEYGPW